MAENFPVPGKLYLANSRSDHLVYLRLYDTSNRLLELDAKVTRQAQGCIRVSCHSPLCLLQDGRSH